MCVCVCVCGFSVSAELKNVESASPGGLRLVGLVWIVLDAVDLILLECFERKTAVVLGVRRKRGVAWGAQAGQIGQRDSVIVLSGFWV